MIRLLGKISLTIILTLAISSAIFVAALMGAVSYFAPPSFSTSLATVQNVTAASWLVFDIESGEIIYKHKSDDVLPIASVTKLATAKVFIEANDIWATTTIVWSDVIQEGRAGKLSVGQIYTFHTLLFPLLLESSNDAAETFKRNDESLIEAMNAYADALGLSDTSFKDASGLSGENVSTANDLALLLRDIYKNNRHLLDITRLSSYISPKNGWFNNDPFVDEPGFAGGKHGYTPEADHTILVLFNEQLKNGAVRTIGYVLLGSADLRYDISLLRDHVQNNVRFD